jgi:hypothetical protein
MNGCDKNTSRLVGRSGSEQRRHLKGCDTNRERAVGQFLSELRKDGWGNFDKIREKKIGNLKSHQRKEAQKI